MNEHTKRQQGSPTRDLFKRKHKDLHKSLFACDLDFVFVEKVPIPDIVAAIDYKTRNDNVTFSEVIAYNALVRRGIPVFVVTGDAESGEFTIRRFAGGHHRKPIVRYFEPAQKQVSNWREFEAWEVSLREEYRARFGDSANKY
jgi:2-oxoglutarate dehydrogenase complex dehydrogenase (E1) component-like enzyme